MDVLVSQVPEETVEFPTPVLRVTKEIVEVARSFPHEHNPQPEKVCGRSCAARRGRES